MSSSDKFSIVRDGYSTIEVDKFLKVVTTEFEKLVSKNSNLEATICELNDVIKELESKTNSVDKFKNELDSYLESVADQKTTLELEVRLLEKKLKEYENIAKDIFYQQIELLEKIG